MKEIVVKIRDSLSGVCYKYLCKPIFFKVDPEEIHDSITRAGNRLGKSAIMRSLVHVCFHYKHPLLKQKIAGITFENPIGLAAGFDKEAVLTDILPHVGFGFEEVGSI